MSTVHTALESLRPREWSDFPEDHEALKDLLQDTFSSAELIVSSIPQFPGGSELTTCRPQGKAPNYATSASEIQSSSARTPLPTIDDLESLQKGWGKPVKLGTKDNPLGMSIWKMAGHDRHGAWFARRSVHEGLGFTKWKKAMQREFAESLKVEGGPGEGSVRGIGADRRLEKMAFDGVGTLDVFQLSAQFPGPVAPREFLTALMTTESGLTEQSAVPSGGGKVIPRHYMVVSIPCDHPDAPPRQNLVRGSYESVEMIREIPLNPVKSKSTPNLLSSKSDSPASDSHSEQTDLRDHSSDDPELNPVEWLMITRSDPGGGIPRFMVERNTPASIASDAVKFLNWATSLDEVPEPDEDADQQEEVQEKVKERQERHEFHPAETNGHLAGVAPLSMNQSLTGAFEPSRPGDTGIIASLTNAAEAYIPDMVKEKLGLGGEESQSTEAFPAYDSDSDESFDSVPEMTADWKTAYEGPRTPDALDTDSSLSLPVGDPSDGFENSSDRRHYDREIKKLAQRRKTLDERMEKARETELKKKAELESKEEKDQEKQRERLEKERQKQEEKYKKEMEKLEQKRAREEEKMEAKRRKARDKDANARDRRERDEYKRRVELLQRENELLRRQLGELQRENTVLVQRIGKLNEGSNMVRSVREELRRTASTPRSSSDFMALANEERERASSVQSRGSKRSGETLKSKLSGVESASEERLDASR